MMQLDRSATEQDVKKAYRRMSLQFHPDKNSAPEAVPIFLQISQAYRALTGTPHIRCTHPLQPPFAQRRVFWLFSGVQSLHDFFGPEDGVE
jgi:hypothetical protein